MVSAERETIHLMAVWGGTPSGQRGLVRGSGGEPPEAESLLAFRCPKEGKI